MIDPFDVSGRRVVVTGAASGLGLAMAKGLSARGAKVALLDFDDNQLSSAMCAEEIAGRSNISVVVDVSDRTGLESAFDTVAHAYDGIDVVFANAGIAAGPGFSDIDGVRSDGGALEAILEETWNRVIAVDLSAAFWTLQSAARVMKAMRSGKIIFTTSISAFRNEAWVGTPYMPAKAGVSHMMRQAALELAVYGVTVNAIAPGFFPTNIGKGRPSSPFEKMAKRIPLGRYGSHEDIQALAVFLASNASNFMTGVEIPLDGGMALGRI